MAEVPIEGWLERLPYTLHTGRELDLMLAGRKPLAVFDVEWPSEPDDFFEQTAFDAHVAAGRFVKRDVGRVLEKPITTADGRQVTELRTYLYATPDQAWRIDAMLFVRSQVRIEGWNRTLERMEGTLLGYSDDENAAWLARCTI